MRLRVLLGDAREVLGRMAADSVDACVTDPPAGIAFMGQKWDRPDIIGTANGLLAGATGRTHSHGVRDADRDLFIAFLTDIFTEVRRVLKPGGHALVWSLPRTSHWTGMALEEAGFEVRDNIASLVPGVLQIFGSGFPKGPSQLKPSYEFWWLVRKPLAAPNVASNIERWGTGELNIAASRVDASGGRPKIIATRGGAPGATYQGGLDGSLNGSRFAGETTQGRWPPNLLLSHVASDAHGEGGCRRVGTRRVRSGTHVGHNRMPGELKSEQGYGWRKVAKDEGYADPDGTELVEAFECVAGCPVAELDRQSGDRRSAGLYPTTYSHSEGYGGGIGKVQGPLYEDTGSASRFFPTFQPDQDDFIPWRYVAKADTAERNEGCWGLDPRANRVNAPRECEAANFAASHGNHHPTVKPLTLCRWLITLITPPDGTILDPFMGSGSTGCAAAQLGFNFIGIEQDPTYHEIAVARIRHWAGLFGQVETEEAAE